MEKNVPVIFLPYIEIADMIVETFGDRVEVVIHDLRQPSSSLIYIKGKVTRRPVGAPTTNIILKELRRHGNDVKNKYGFTSRTVDGQMLKSSILFIRDQEQQVIGYCGINFDMTALLQAQTVLYELTLSTGLPYIHESDMTEHYANNMEEVFEAMIKEVLHLFPMSVEQMKKEEKVEVIRELDERGIFLVQGASERIASLLNVSKQTVYNYLDVVRKQEKRLEDRKG
ncbi:helix-turn-helix transcriptional regulator [Desmospora activa]|uniref:Putative transcriptional regulator YheO n=1 Tax=Desmospora activa DSM 45169 TaxID=1121389 RepID=A0A2T4Z9Y1_9BACL|nr:helix-turn-helix transcriptional regulator [Desmospora activa]PTM58698.1 putative transcriptional regulator YheO [Desmospora activa DSM 45169]